MDGRIQTQKRCFSECKSENRKTAGTWDDPNQRLLTAYKDAGNDERNHTTMSTVTVTEGTQPQAKDIASRLLNGTLHAQWPNIEEFQTIDGLLISHAAQPDDAKRPLICYPIQGAADFEEHTAGDIDRYTDVAVCYYVEQGLPPAVRNSPAF